jgi:CelD/BcsL family acetyltransferase involved in cellulose biosynthesis
MLVYPRGQERVLTLMGAGVSDDQDVLLQPADAAECMASVWAFLQLQVQPRPQTRRARQRFDVCELETLPANSALLHHLPRAGWQVGPRLRQDVRPVLRLPANARELRQVAPPTMVKQVQYLRRRAERDGLAPRVARADPATLRQRFGEFVQLHRQRWVGTGQPDMLPERLVAFHAEVARRMQREGLLRLYVLYFQHTPAAAFYGFQAGRRTVYYLGGFEPRFKRYSPGTLVVAHAVERALLEDDSAEFDFLRGAEGYKYAWGAVEQEVFRCDLAVVGEPVEAGRVA